MRPERLAESVGRCARIDLLRHLQAARAQALHDADPARMRVGMAMIQAEQIQALRAWANVRAVAASAPQDRAGYLTPGEDAAGPAVDPEATRSRGGRIVAGA